MKNTDLLKTMKKSLDFIQNSDNYHNGGEPANSLVPALQEAIAAIERGAITWTGDAAQVRGGR